MEEQRIGMMYLNLFKRWMAERWGGMFPRGFRRSPALPILAVLFFVGAPVLAWMLHRAGRFAAVKREIKGEEQGNANLGPRPGGLDPIFLKRSQSPGSNAPEFRSVTLLPGLGMTVLQITAFLPGKGEVNLLAAPTLQEVSDGTTPPRVGPNDRWGAIELPWSGMVTGILTPVGSEVRTAWHGKPLEAPTDVPARGVAEGGMLGTLAADSTDVAPGQQPGRASATFKARDFEGHWVGKSDVVVTVTLNGQTIDLEVSAKNNGDLPEPMGIGWHPRFSIPSGYRDSAELRMPSGDSLEIADHLKGIPSGSFGAPMPSLSRYQSRSGVLGLESLDESVVHLKGGGVDHGASAELRDLASEFGLRLTAVSNNTLQMRGYSPAGSRFVSLGAQTNLDDPFGKEWASAESAMPALLPGQTVDWKVRLDIFPISGHPGERQ